MAYAPSEWHSFFATAATAAATLTGLFFIAFSLRVPDLQRSTLIRTRARYLLLGLIVLFAASIFVLMPGQPRGVLAAELLAVVTPAWLYALGSIVHVTRQEGLRVARGVVARHAGMAVAVAFVGAGSLSLVVRTGGGLYLVAFGAVLGLAIEVASAWSLIVGIGEDTGPSVEAMSRLEVDEHPQRALPRRHRVSSA